jgi:copper chaperone CopZ
MKKFKILIAILALSVASFASPAVLKVQTNITCGGCASKIKTAMAKVEGIDKTDIDVDSKVVTLNYDDAKLNQKDLAAKITKLGYTAEVVGDNEMKAEPKQCSTKTADKQCSTKKCCSTKKK